MKSPWSWIVCVGSLGAAACAAFEGAESGGCFDRGDQFLSVVVPADRGAGERRSETAHPIEFDMWLFDPSALERPVRIGIPGEMADSPRVVWRAGPNRAVIAVGQRYWMLDFDCSERSAKLEEMEALRGCQFVDTCFGNAYLLSAQSSDVGSSILALNADGKSPPSVLYCDRRAWSLVGVSEGAFWCVVDDGNALVAINRAGDELWQWKLSPRGHPSRVESEFAPDGSRLAVWWHCATSPESWRILIVDTQSGGLLYESTHELVEFRFSGISGAVKWRHLAEWVSADEFAMLVNSGDEIEIIDCGKGPGVLRRERLGDLPAVSPRDSDGSDWVDIGGYWRWGDGCLVFKRSGSVALVRMRDPGQAIVASPSGRQLAAIGFRDDGDTRRGLFLIDGQRESLFQVAGETVVDARWLPAVGGYCREWISTTEPPIMRAGLSEAPTKR